MILTATLLAALLTGLLATLLAEVTRCVLEEVHDRCFRWMMSGRKEGQASGALKCICLAIDSSAVAAPLGCRPVTRVASCVGVPLAQIVTSKQSIWLRRSNRGDRRVCTAPARPSVAVSEISPGAGSEDSQC